MPILLSSTSVTLLGEIAGGLIAHGIVDWVDGVVIRLSLVLLHLQCTHSGGTRWMQAYIRVRSGKPVQQKLFLLLITQKLIF